MPPGHSGPLVLDGQGCINGILDRLLVGGGHPGNDVMVVMWGSDVPGFLRHSALATDYVGQLAYVVGKLLDTMQYRIGLRRSRRITARRFICWFGDFKISGHTHGRHCHGGVSFRNPVRNIAVSLRPVTAGITVGLLDVRPCGASGRGTNDPRMANTPAPDTLG